MSKKFRVKSKKKKCPFREFLVTHGVATINSKSLICALKIYFA